jgi:SP family galactose:H+ symporter-like MFS transporter
MRIAGLFLFPLLASSLNYRYKAGRVREKHFRLRDQSMRKTHIYLIAFASALSGLLFGYDAGIIASAMLFIKKQFLLDDSMIGLIVSAVPLGALFASLLSGKLSDAIGRKKSLFISAILFSVGSLLCAFSQGANALIVGRLLLGFAIGIGSCISPVYTAELSREHQRGWLVTTFVVMIQFGVFLSFAVGYLLSTHEAWRLMIGLGVLPALLLGSAALILPESPRWLLVRNQKQKAMAVFSQIHGAMAAKLQIDEIEKVLAHQKNTSSSLFQPQFLRVILIGAAVSFFTQTIGINVLNYYAPTIFQSTGFASAEAATRMTMFMGLVLTLSTISSLFFIDKIGRRLPLLVSMVGILLSLMLIAGAFTFIHNPVWLGWAMFVGTIIFMVFHGMGVGPACFLIPSEIFPARVRGVGMGVSVACNWGANVVVAYLTPVALGSIGAANLFFILFAVTVVGFIVFYLYVPETKNVSLEVIETNILDNVRSRDLGKQLAAELL